MTNDRSTHKSLPATAARGIGGSSHLRGHRPVVFDQLQEATLPEQSEYDVLLLCDNMIVASTAKRGRYAAGEAFFGRNPARYSQLAADQTNNTTDRFRAFLHVRSVVLISDALYADTAMIPALVLHGNTRRIRRVLCRCFPEVLLMHAEDDAAVGGSLRHDDEPCFSALRWLLPRFGAMLAGAGERREITDHAALLRATSDTLVRLLALIDPTLSHRLGEDTAPPLHFPCPGEINVSQLIATLLCVLLGVRELVGSLPPRAAWDDLHLYPCFVLDVGQEARALLPSLQQHSAIQAAARLARRYQTTLSLDADRERLVIRVCALHPRRQALYSLRARRAPSLRGARHHTTTKRQCSHHQAVDNTATPVRKKGENKWLG